MHEIVRGSNRKSGPLRAVLKVDTMKAFDTVEWNFLFETLKLTGFPEMFIHWIKLGVETAQFSINLNGSLVGYFRSGRDLRQGNPISPYLFLIAMEAFSKLLEWNIQQNEYDYHPKCKQLGISHLTLANVLFITQVPPHGLSNLLQKLWRILGPYLD